MLPGKIAYLDPFAYDTAKPTLTWRVTFAGQGKFLN
jgi:hypothetical protein